MANITITASSASLGSLLTQWNALVTYSNSIDPSDTTLYQAEDGLVAAYYGAFSAFDSGSFTSYSLPNGGTSGYIVTSGATLYLYGSFSTSGSTVTKLSLSLGDGATVVADGSFHYAGLPYITSLIIGSQIDNVASTTPDPIDPSNSVFASVAGQLYFDGFGYSGALSAFSEGYFDSTDQKYLNIYAATAGQTAQISPDTYSVSDGTLTGVAENVLNVSGNTTDTLSAGGLNLDLAETPRLNWTEEALAGSDTFSVSGNGAFDNLGDLVGVDAAMTSATFVTSAAIVQNNLDVLETIAEQGKLGTITLTDTGTPTITVTAQQASADATALAHIVTPFRLVSGVACYVAGTRITTPRSDVSVEALAQGDLVRTADGRHLAIRWIGRRRVDCERHPRPQDVWPVRIAAGAFCAGQPQRALFLSPDHAVFVDGALIPIRYLINAASIVQMPVDVVTYWHVELEHHDLILAEGLPCESFLDTGNRAAFENGGEVVHLHADFALRLWDGDACAPLVVAGPRLEQARARLQTRLAAQDAIYDAAEQAKRRQG